MISEIKSASDHSMALLMGDKENILKSILRQLFEGIYREIEGKCNFTEENREHINEFLAWPDDYDLTDTAFFFNRRLFGHQIFDRVRNGKQFSLGELDTIIQHPKSKIKQVKTSIVAEDPPDFCYDTVPEGKAGNMKLANGCTWCPHKFECRKDSNDGKGLRVFNYAKGPVYFTSVVSEPKVEEQII